MDLQAQSSQLVSVTEAAELLRLSRATLYRLQHRDPAFPKLLKVGGSSRFRLIDLETYVSEAMPLTRPASETGSPEESQQ